MEAALNAILFLEPPIGSTNVPHIQLHHLGWPWPLIGQGSRVCGSWGIPVRLVPDVILGHENMKTLDEQLKVFKTI